MNKLATQLAFNCGGMTTSNNGDYLKVKGKSAFKNIVIRAIIKYCIDNNKWTNNGENTLAIVVKAE